MKIKYEVRNLLAESNKLKRERNFDGAKTALEKIIALPGVSGEQKQKAYLAQRKCTSPEKILPVWRIA